MIACHTSRPNRPLRGAHCAVWTGWNEQRVGLALTVGGIAGILTQTPAGALVDRLRSKRALITAGIVALAAGAWLIALVPAFWSVMSAQVLIGGTSSIFGPAICAVSLGIVGRKFGLSLPCRGRGGRIRHPFLLHAGDTR
jgi:MFS family permease